jgi:hypothetical protein
LLPACNRSGLVTIDTPLSDKAYLTGALKNVSNLLPGAQKAALATILNWTNPGPGGFYDQLGAAANTELLRDAKDMAATFRFSTWKMRK